ncbi:unnamed protein product [Trichogramma brassicae]|uniref:Uncharacterized protein n=1 Tax=Trichogramma brassicae TaxID=86971 RepID=A0A6H5IGB8_9HYME|nr:unnamed protein product [Trichogramma brassicae]
MSEAMERPPFVQVPKPSAAEYDRQFTGARSFTKLRTLSLNQADQLLPRLIICASTKSWSPKRRPTRPADSSHCSRQNRRKGANLTRLAYNLRLRGSEPTDRRQTRSDTAWRRKPLRGSVARIK